MTSSRCTILAVLALSVYLGNFAQGAVFTNTFPEDPAHPGKCYDPDLKLAVEQGGVATDHTQCTRLRCSMSRFDPKEFTFSGETCIYSSHIPTNCRVVDGDLTKDFPECCSQVECDGEPESPLVAVG